MKFGIGCLISDLDVNFYRLSLFSISPSCIFIVSAVVAEDAGIKGKGQKNCIFLFLMTVVGIIVVVVQHLLITYISFDLLFFFLFEFFGRRRVSIVGRYVSIIVDFSLH